MSSPSRKTLHSLSIFAASVMFAATSFAPANAQLIAPRLSQAVAQDAKTNGNIVQVGGRRHGGRRGHRNYGYGNGGVIAGGIIGLTTGLIIGGALNQGYYGTPYYGSPANGYDRSRAYYQGAPRAYQAPTPVYREGYAAWSPEWYTYCARKYRSFNPRTGYFLAYSGKYHFCR